MSEQNVCDGFDKDWLIEKLREFYVDAVAGDYSNEKRDPDIDAALREYDGDPLWPEGPWSIDEFEEHVHTWVIQGKTGDDVLRFEWEKGCGSVRANDAALGLMLKAPEVYEQLCAAENWLGELAGCDTPDDGLRGLLADIAAIRAEVEGEG